MLSTFKTNFQDKFNNTSFKAKATLAAIALGVLPIATIGTLNYFQISSINQQQTAKAELERAELVADKLNRFIFERNGDVATLSSLPVFADPQISKIATPQTRSALLERYSQSYGVYDSIAAFDLNGQPIAQIKRLRSENQIFG